MPLNHPTPKYSIRFCILLAVTLFQTNCYSQDTKEFVDLFASGDFSGWRVGNKGKGWSIKEGVVRLDTPKSGSLITRDRFRDFELRFEWKISEGGNSGVIYRSQKGRGLEYQILDDRRHVRGKGPLWSAGALYDLVGASKEKVVRPAGQWNSGKIIANKKHIEHWLNGKKILEIDLDGNDWKKRYLASKYIDNGLNHFGDVASPITLQDHGQTVAYRKVLIKSLDVSPKTTRSGYDFPVMISRVPAKSKFIDPDYYIWGASMVKDDDGLYHLFYSRWPKSLTHFAWVTHSEIAHATSNSPLGPYQHVDVVLPERGIRFWDGVCTHNPTVHEFDGKYYLYYMGNTGEREPAKRLNWTHRNQQRIGVAVADHPNGPWKRFDEPLIDVSANETAHDALMTSNPSILRRPDGKFVLIYKAVGKKRKLPQGGPVVHLAATSDSPTGPFEKLNEPLFVVDGIDFPAEDPYIWSDKTGCWAIVNDHKGSFTGTGQDCLALFQSQDGLTWKVADHPMVLNRRVTWEKGRAKPQSFHRLERPQLWLENGIPKVLFCAAEETKQKKHSYNVHIPLNIPKSSR